MTARRRHSVGWDWAGPHGTVSGTTAVCGWALASVVAADVIGLSRWWAPAVAVAGAFATQIVSAHQHLARSTQVYRAACWVGLGGWGWWAIDRGVWRPETVAVLILLALAGGLLAGEYARLEEEEQDRRAQEAAALTRDKRGRKWEQILEAVTSTKGCRVKALEDWADGRGYTVEVKLPGDGSTWRSFIHSAEGLAAAAGLPNGCGVEPAPGHDRSHMLLKVSTSNVMADLLSMPEDMSPTSINDPKFVGWTREGTPVEADMRQARWIHGAAPGTGKTTQQNKVIREVGRCTDALGWVVDMNSAALGVPWVIPWLEGRAERPVVDWLAGDADEAYLMTRAMLAVMADRKVSAGEAKRAANVTLMPVGPDLPAIVLVGDEMSEFLGVAAPHGRVRENIAEGFRKGRDAGLCYALSVLRGTAEYIDTSLLQFCDVIVVMNPSGDKEIADFLGWQTGMTAEDAPYAGCAIARTGKNARVQPLKCPDLKPDEIDQFAVELAGLRPELDQRGQDAIARAFEQRDSTGNVVNDGRWVYEQRWERAAKWLGTRELVSAGNGGPMPNDQKWPKPTGSVEDAITKVQDSMAEVRRVAEQAQKDDGASVDDAFQSIVSQFDGDTDARARVWQMLVDAGATGSTPTKIEIALRGEGYSTARATIHGWIREWVAEGRLYQAGPREPYVVREQSS